MPQPKNLRNRSLNLCRQICQAYDLEVHLVLVREKDGQQPGGHGVVEDRVDGGVDVEHETRKVQEVVEQLRRKASINGQWTYVRKKMKTTSMFICSWIS